MQHDKQQIINIMKSKQQKIKDLAAIAFRKMVMESREKALAMILTGVKAKDAMEVSKEIDEMLKKWRGEE